jgi:hypothetical protein
MVGHLMPQLTGRFVTLGIWRQLLSRHCRRSDWLDYATDPMGYGPSYYDRQRQVMVTALQTHFGDCVTILGEKEFPMRSVERELIDIAMKMLHCMTEVAALIIEDAQHHRSF